MRILANKNFNFIRWRWHAFVLSVAVIAAGAFAVASRGGLPLGIDFSGGTIVVLQFTQPVGEEVVRQRARAGHQRIGGPADRWPRREPDHGAAPDDGRASRRAPTSRRAPSSSRIRCARRTSATSIPLKKEIVGPVIGKDLQRKGIYATIASLIGIMTYIALRFRLSFGVGAAIASVHDVLVTLAILTLSGYELSLNVIAAILTLTGYGVNDQIVVFDRVRENLRTSRQRTDGRGHQPEREPDPAPDRDHGRRHVSGGVRALPVRRGSARGLRVRDARGDRHEHLLDDLHRVGGCRPAEPGPDAAGRAGAAATSASSGSKPRGRRAS